MTRFTSLTSKLLSLCVLLGLSLTACGQEEESGDTPSTNASMGGAQLDPSKPENMTMNDAMTTSDTCGDAEDCAYWYCRCEDGAIINSRTCNNNVCLGPGAICQDSCTAFGSGNWTGYAGGGVKQEPPKKDPPASGNNTSGGGDGGGQTCPSTIADSSSSCDQCTRENCCTEAVTCEGNLSCLDYFDCHAGDGFSRADCDEFYPAGASDYDALVTCLLDVCLDACN